MISTLERRRGNMDEVENTLAEARENLAYIVDHIGDPELKSTFLDQPDVRMVYETLK